MAKVVPFKHAKPKAKTFTVHDARDLIRRLAQDSKNVIVITHAKQRQGERNISRRQIMTCLQKGAISEGPFLNMHGNWQVNVQRLAAGEQITCVVAIEHEQKLIVITAF